MNLMQSLIRRLQVINNVEGNHNQRYADRYFGPLVTVRCLLPSVLPK
jgi:hypothetical protein